MSVSECGFCHRTFVGYPPDSIFYPRVEIRVPVCRDCLEDLCQIELFVDENLGTIERAAKHARRFIQRVEGRKVLAPLFAKCPECQNIVPYHAWEKRLGFHYKKKGKMCWSSGAYIKDARF